MLSLLTSNNVILITIFLTVNLLCNFTNINFRRPNGLETSRMEPNSDLISPIWHGHDNVLNDINPKDPKSEKM